MFGALFIAFLNFLLGREQIAPNKSFLTVLFSHPACDYNVSGNLSYAVSSTTYLMRFSIITNIFKPLENSSINITKITVQAFKPQALTAQVHFEGFLAPPITIISYFARLFMKFEKR